MNSDEKLRRVRVHQLRSQDERIAEFRQFYESIPTEEKARFRQWLIKLRSVELECELGASVRVELQQHIVTIRMSTSGMLGAIEAWDNGDTFVPHTVMPL